MENIELKTMQKVLSEMKFLKKRNLPTSKDFENYVIIIESLEKQIPIKPDELDTDYGTFACGVCGVEIGYMDDYESHNYCLICGQKIDWD